MGYQLASIFAGGLAPLIATSLIALTGGDPWGVAVYLIGMCIVTFISVYVTSETNKKRVNVTEKTSIEKSIH
jgi:hypothetical protein